MDDSTENAEKQMDVRAPESMTRLGDQMTHVVYTCRNPKCRAQQTLKFFPGEVPWVVIGCSDCKECSGSGQTLPEMVQSGRGMFPDLGQLGTGSVN